MAATITFGYDVSNVNPYHRIMNHKQAYAEGYRFCMAKSSEGHSFQDLYFDGNRKAAEAAGLLFGAYHRVSTSTPASEAANAASVIKDKSIPVFLDTEQGSGNEVQNYLVAQELRKLGFRVPLNYLPRWYWQQIGSPHIRTGPLWSSIYVSGTGFGSTLYTKVPASSWNGYGGQSVELLQFTDKAKIAGEVIDASAFRGTLAELKAWWTGKPAPTPTPAPAPVPTPAPSPAAVVTTLKGTPLDLSWKSSGSGPRYKWRNLINTNGVYPGAVCDCIPRYIALVEALAKEAGLPTPLRFWEGSFITTANSGTTHAGGGALDIVIDGWTDAQINTLVKIGRQAGGADYYRGPGTQYGNFSTKHIHCEIIGCTHASAAARTQWQQYKNGRDALAINGPDYGPKVTYITADNAYKALTKSGDWFDMATPKEIQDAIEAGTTAALSKFFGDVIPSAASDPAARKKNPDWTLGSYIKDAYVNQEEQNKLLEQLVTLLTPKTAAKKAPAKRAAAKKTEGGQA